MAREKTHTSRNGRVEATMRRGALAAAVGAALAAGTGAQAAGNPFAVQELPGGYMVAGKGSEGSCAGMRKGAKEGQCAGMKSKDDSAKGGKEGTCAGMKGGAAPQKAKKEGRCGEGKCGGGM